MNVKITGDEKILSRLKCYALLAPHLDGGGAGNSARSIDVAGRRCLLAWKGNSMLAMGADCGFSRSSCGYVGTSDGYQDLCSDMKMTWQFGQALMATSRSWARSMLRQTVSSPSRSRSETATIRPSPR